MQKNKSYKKIGIFVFIGILCFIGIMFQYISKRFIVNEDDWVVMFFEESVRGLNVGSPVVMHGVEIGKVEKIGLMANIEEGIFKTPVFVKFDLKKIFDNTQEMSDYLRNRSSFDNLIDKGLRARLTSSNYLTGQLMIELLMDPKSKPVFHGEKSWWEIPTEYSKLTAISNDLQGIPLRETLLNFANVVDVMNKELPSILQNMNSVTASLNKTINLKSTETSKTLYNVNDTLEQVSRMSLSIKNLADYIERHPESLIYGKGK